MKKWFKSHIVLSVVSTALIAVVGVPFAINELYKLDKGYITVWTGPEFLAYYGTILGAAATILTLTGTILFTRRQILFERYIQRETAKWEEIERLFRDAIILAEPIHLTTMFYNNVQNKTLDVCLEIETYMTGLSEAIDRLDVTIEEKDMPNLNELLKQLREIADEDSTIAKEYDTLLTRFWTLQSCPDTSREHVIMMLDIAKERDEINLRAKNLREQKYHTLLQTKKQTFSKIYDDLDRNSQKILILDDGVANGT